MDADAATDDSCHWNLRLYVAGKSPKSMIALANLRALCDTYLVGRCTIDVIDVLEHPEVARADQIIAIPTLVRRLPEPIRKIIGDLSRHQRVLVGLDLEPVGP